MLDLNKKYVHLCKRICERIPQKKRDEKIFPALEYAGINEDFDFWLGKKIILAIILFLIGLITPWSLGKYFNLIDFNSHLIQFVINHSLISISSIPILLSILLSIILPASFFLFTYFQIYYRIESRTKIVESILPDFLFLVASNISAGMTPFSAFRASARKEFSPLNEEVKLATSKSLGTESFGSALKELSKRIKSRALKETVYFFTQAMKSGGRLTKLLETTANDLRNTQEMKKELISSTKMYVIFVAFVVIIGTPLLLSVAVQFLDMITKIQTENVLGSSEVSSLGFLSNGLNISSKFMQTIALILLLGNAILSSLFMGLISDGKTKMGLRYAPLIAIASIIVFIITRTVLSAFLGGI